MHKSKMPVFNFLLAIILLLSFILPASVNAATIPVKKWSITYSGQPLFNPMVQKDGSLFVGKYNIVKGVYSLDFMTVDSNGKQKSNWKVTGASEKNSAVAFGGNVNSPVVYKFNMEKGIVFAFDQKGKQKWKKDYSQSITNYHADPNGYLYLAVGKYMKGLSTGGKELFSINLPTYKDSDGKVEPFDFYDYRFLSDGSFLLCPDINGQMGRLAKFNQYGKKLWDKQILKKDSDGSLLNEFSTEYMDKNILVIIAGFRNQNDPSNYDDDQFYYKILMVDSNGKILSQSKVNSNYIQSIRKIGGQYHLVSDDGKYFIYNTNGKLVRTSILVKEDPANYEWVNEIKDNGSGTSYIMIGGEKNHLLSYDKNGKQLWKVDLSPNTNLSDVIQKNGLWIYNVNVVFSYSSQGKVNWQFQIKEGERILNIIPGLNGNSYIQSIKNIETLDGIQFQTTIMAVNGK